jgi:hypothetical protein
VDKLHRRHWHLEDAYSKVAGVKKTLYKIAGKLGRSVFPRGNATPPWTKAKRTSSGEDFPIAAGDVTGQTIFDDRPLRFRSLTLAQPDFKALEAAAGIEGAFKIRLAKFAGGPREAGVLVERRYSGRGYQIPAANVDPSLFTFLAYNEGNVVGTVGVRLDSPKRLTADDIYPDELAKLRAEGHRLCEFTRLAVDTSSASKPVLAGLFHTAYLYAAVISGCTHAVIEVNPRHVNYYRKALKFEEVGPERMNKRVMAPAVLLWVAFSTIADGVARYAGRPDEPGAKMSLFLYGFPAKDELGVLQRLRALLVPA